MKKHMGLSNANAETKNAILEKIVSLFVKDDKIYLYNKKP